MVDATLVAVHGFGSSSATWDRLCAVWQADAELQGPEDHRFGYPSPKTPRLLSPGTRVPGFDDTAQMLAALTFTVLRRCHRRRDDRGRRGSTVGFIGTIPFAVAHAVEFSTYQAQA